MADPVEDELVSSLARPGGNVTGTTFLGPELVSKRLQLLKEIVPGLSRVVVLWHPDAYGQRTMSGMPHPLTYNPTVCSGHRLLRRVSPLMTQGGHPGLRCIRKAPAL